MWGERNGNITDFWNGKDQQSLLKMAPPVMLA